MANSAASVRSGTRRTHGPDVLFPSADIPLLTGLAKGGILRCANRSKVPCDLLAGALLALGSDEGSIP
jgi:hypothetical protein